MPAFRCADRCPQVAKQYCAGALCNFTKTKEIRNVLVELGEPQSFA
jgi:ribosomal protein L37E